MKNPRTQKSSTPRTRPADFPVKPGKRKAFLASVRQMDEQCDSLGLVDPEETEPAILYRALEEEK